jgi:predicted transcriptional regulator
MLRVRDIMTSDVIALSPQTSLLSAVQLFADSQVTGAPVVEGSKVVGVLSASDLMEFTTTSTDDERRGGESVEPERGEDFGTAEDVERGDEPAAALSSDFFGAAPTAFLDPIPGSDRDGIASLAGHEVGELMTRRIWSVRPDDQVAHAASVMQRAKIHRVLVMEDDRLVGIVTTTDIARAVADGSLTRHTYVFNRDGDFDER